ncbi:EamA family transporter [Hymenobacter psychrotolerans]|uniref:Chloramphenicol-sensitive protein RarD n=1 Tax=Hymenobacter psychrotolerans DSM 18569 TaxID=1121959 RepID=A0A1M6P463_9BACT|nr:EamA family transporter [Hymenobacter psychrotolerans]SHK02692.1 chloramphenicol-sensitive protein RarD [Hymenobacter psychrotolerans DSM 18569]
MKLSRHHLAALAAFLIWGFFPIPLRLLGGYASGQILFFRVLLSLLLLVLIHGLGRREAVRATWRQWQAAPAAERRGVALSTALGGLLLTANWLLFIYVVNEVSVQAGSFAYLICPILTALLGFLLLRENLRPNQWAAIGLSALSCALLGVGELRTLLMSLVVAFTYALYLITQRRLQGYDRLALLTVQLGLAAAVILPLAPLLGAHPLAGLADGRLLLVTAVLSAVFTVLPLFLNLYALNVLPSGTVGILMYLNPIVSFALAFLYFGEAATAVQGAAYGVILGSVVLYNFRTSR